MTAVVDTAVILKGEIVADNAVIECQRAEVIDATGDEAMVFANRAVGQRCIGRFLHKKTMPEAVRLKVDVVDNRVARLADSEI